MARKSAPLHIPQTDKFVCSSHGPFVVPSMSCGEDLGCLNACLKVKVVKELTVFDGKPFPMFLAIL